MTTTMTAGVPEFPDEMTAGEMLENFTLGLLRVKFWLTAEQSERVRAMYTEHTADNGDAIIVLHDDIRALLFSNRSREHLDRMLGLVKGGVTGTEALRAAIAGNTTAALVSGTL